MMEIPILTARETSDLDQKLIEDYGIELAMMMENAGRALAVQSIRLLGEPLNEKRVLVLAGKGNNGGGGLVCARHLHNRGIQVEVALAFSSDHLGDLPSRQLRILDSMKVPVDETLTLPRTKDYHMILDALLGYNQKGDPRGRVGELVEAANDSGRPIIALDIPTGLDPDSGTPNNPCIRAAQTLALAVLKRGLLEDQAKSYVGELFVADISVPREMYLELGKKEPPSFDLDGIAKVF